MTKQFNVHVIVKAPDCNKAMTVWVKVRDFLKKEFGEEAISLEFFENRPNKYNDYYGEIFLYITEPKIVPREVRENANNR